jgi:hypothetical protein
MHPTDFHWQDVQRLNQTIQELQRSKLRLAARIGGLTRANNLLRERLRQGHEVCYECCCSLENRGALSNGEHIWCLPCARKLRKKVPGGKR